MGNMIAVVGCIIALLACAVGPGEKVITLLRQEKQSALTPLEKSSKVYNIVVLIVLILLICIIACFLPSTVQEWKNSEKDGQSTSTSNFSTDEQTAMVLILGNHANAKKIPDKAFDELEYYTCGVTNNGYLAIVIPDSCPDLYGDLSHEFAESGVALSAFVNSRNYRANDRDVDLLKAITVASEALKDKEYRQKVICIIDPGISTSGAIDFNNFGSACIDEIQVDDIVAEVIVEHGNDIFPDLSGFYVVIIGEIIIREEVGFPSPAGCVTMTDDHKWFIKEIWDMILNKKCGAQSVEYKSVEGWVNAEEYVHIDGDEDSYPSVAPVMFQTKE